MMQTKQLYFQNKINDPAIKEAASYIQSGEVVAFPTETVYGLGADATNNAAIKKIFQAKGRPADNPLIVHVAERKQMVALVEEYPTYVDELMKVFSPGPITYVLKSNGTVANLVTAGLETVGIRMPSHPAARALLMAANRPVAAPSANLSGKPSPTNATHVKEDMDGKIAAILDGGAANVGVESTVIDCTGEYPVILRHGGVTAAQINEVIQVETKQIKASNKPKSPGVKYKHYMPDVPLILVNDVTKLQEIIQTEQAKNKRVGALVSDQTAEKIKADKIYRYGKDEQEIARNLYNNLRQMQVKDVDIVYAEKITANTIGYAVLDRLQRAADSII